MPKIPDTNGQGTPRVPGGIEVNRSSRFSRLPEGREGVVADVASYLSDYIVLPPTSILVVAAWTLAAWQADSWDRFPHLAITSPDRRCGKTRLLDLLRYILREACATTNISPAALYRLIGSVRPTLLLDEAQSIRRRASEMSEVLRELLNAGIDRDAAVYRVGGKNNDQIQSFPIYCPKAIALIGELDGVLADRCLPVDMKRKAPTDVVLPYRSRVVRPIGEQLHQALEAWSIENAERVAQVYDRLDTYPIQNDRMAELLLPLQAVLKVASPGCLPLLEQYALSLDERDTETVSPAVRLLAACREVILNSPASRSVRKNGFIPTGLLLDLLYQRDWEPWCRWSSGRKMTPHALAGLLKPFGIQAGRNRDQSARGFVIHDFQEPWERYLPPHTLPGKAAKPANPLTKGLRHDRRKYVARKRD